MDDATRPEEEAVELVTARAALTELVGELTHEVLTLFRERGVPIGERIARAGGDPLEAVVTYGVTLRVLADGLLDPFEEWPGD